MKRALLLGLTAAALICPPRSGAQVLYGSMVGHVKDASEAAVPDASVTIRNTDTNQTRVTKTNDAGDYSFPTIASGPYELTVGKPGFSGVTRTGLAVSTNGLRNGLDEPTLLRHSPSLIACPSEFQDRRGGARHTARRLERLAHRSSLFADKTFGPGKASIWPGHQIIEMGLAKLYRV